MEVIAGIVLNALLLFGVWTDTGFVANVALGSIWVLSGAAIVTAWSVVKGDADPIREKICNRPAWRVTTFRIVDVAMFVMLAGNGWWFTLALFTTQAVYTYGVENEVRACAK